MVVRVLLITSICSKEFKPVSIEFYAKAEQHGINFCYSAVALLLLFLQCNANLLSSFKVKMLKYAILKCISRCLQLAGHTAKII